MASLREYDEVRVQRLLRSPDAYDGWKLNRRAPRVGDVGTLIDILAAPGAETGYVVECSGPGGETIWLGDFTAEELEPVHPTGEARRGTGSSPVLPDRA